MLATQTLPHSGSGADRVQWFSLTGVEGPAANQTWEYAAGRCAIGTHKSNDLSLNDPMVSRFHCELHVELVSSQIVDLGSKNGTAVDGERLNKRARIDGVHEIKASGAAFTIVSEEGRLV